MLFIFVCFNLWMKYKNNEQETESYKYMPSALLQGTELQLKQTRVITAFSISASILRLANTSSQYLLSFIWRLAGAINDNNSTRLQPTLPKYDSGSSVIRPRVIA